jgi:hypothetical protein
MYSNEWKSTSEQLPEIGRPVWLANETQAWIGWRVEVPDGDDQQSDWAWSEAAYPQDFDASEYRVIRWCPINQPPALAP